MKKVTLFFVLMFALTFGAMAQNLATDIVGTWKLVDIKVSDATGKPAKMTPKLKKELAEGKEMFLGADRMVLEFKDGKMDTVPADSNPAEKYTIKGKSVVTKLAGAQYANVVDGKLEMAMTPAKKDMMVLVFEKQ